MEHFVITEVLIWLIPGQQAALRVEDSRMPRHLGIYVDVFGGERRGQDEAQQQKQAKDGPEHTEDHIFSWSDFQPDFQFVEFRGNVELGNADAHLPERPIERIGAPRD
jgi:hypothetical protein